MQKYNVLFYLKGSAPLYTYWIKLSEWEGDKSVYILPKELTYLQS